MSVPGLPSRSRRIMLAGLRLLALYLMVCCVVFFLQRWLMYFPSHDPSPRSALTEWTNEGVTIGYRREVDSPETVWLMMHGNAGQAAYRDYVLSCVAGNDALYVLEYPGYGARPGSRSKVALDKAASDAYRLLRQQYPGTAVCVAGESLGSGPASMLAQEPRPPEKIVLVTPFDSLYNVAANRFFFLPVWLLLTDRWDNVLALRGYSGELEIYGARQDTIIPISHARRLAEQCAGAEFIEIDGGHNEWSLSGQVQLSWTGELAE